MEQHFIEDCDCYLHVDRMINEGMGGGLLHSKSSERQYQPVDWPVKAAEDEAICPDCGRKRGK